MTDVHEWWYSTASYEQHYRQDDSTMAGMSLSLLNVPGTDMQGAASAPTGFTGTWSSTATSNTAQSMITAASTASFSFMVLPGQTVSVSAYMYTHSESEGHNVPITFPVVYQRGIAATTFFINSGGDAKSATAGDGYTNLDEQTATFATTIYNGSSDAFRQTISLTTDVSISNTEMTADITPVPEPSTWLLMGLGLLVMGYKLKRRDQAFCFKSAPTRN